VIFDNLFKYSKRRHAVPLRPIWTIMVAAKLDHSRVLATKFRQNRSTLKGRSAGQRQTDTQTSRISERAPFRIYEHAQCRVFERTSLQRAYVIPCQVASSKWGSRPLCYEHAAARWCLQRGRGVSRPYLRYGDRGRLQSVSPPSVLFESSRIILQYTGDTDAKNYGPEF